MGDMHDPKGQRQLEADVEDEEQRQAEIDWKSGKRALRHLHYLSGIIDGVQLDGQTTCNCRNSLAELRDRLEELEGRDITLNYVYDRANDCWRPKSRAHDPS